jgi:hypothetical protein
MSTVSKEEVKTHIREHLSYPASKQQLIQACNDMSDVPKSDKEWFENNLPEGNYQTADEVIKALNL